MGRVLLFFVYFGLLQNTSCRSSSKKDQRVLLDEKVEKVLTGEIDSPTEVKEILESELDQLVLIAPDTSSELDMEQIFITSKVATLSVILVSKNIGLLYQLAISNKDVLRENLGTNVANKMIKNLLKISDITAPIIKNLPKPPFTKETSLKIINDLTDQKDKLKELEVIKKELETAIDLQRISIVFVKNQLRPIITNLNNFIKIWSQIVTLKIE